MTGFTTAADLQEHGGDYVKVSQREIRRVVTLQSSGSTGKPKRLYFTAGDLERTVRFFEQGMGQICRPGERVAVCIGSFSPEGLGRLLEEGLVRMGARPTLLGAVTDYAAAARALAAVEPDCVIGLPMQLRRLALLLPELRPRTVLLSGDYVALSLRQSITRLWQSRVFEHYGLTESGLGFAVQCPALCGRHIRTDELAVEIVDPVTGASLPVGSWGEVVFSTLRREAMPLFRYRSGDISRLLPEPCPCGDCGPRLDRILGRVSEGRKPVSVYDLDERLLGWDGILDYEAYWRKGGLWLKVQLAPGGSLSQVARLLRGLRVCLHLQSGSVLPTAEKRMLHMEDGPAG